MIDGEYEPSQIWSPAERNVSIFKRGGVAYLEFDMGDWGGDIYVMKYCVDPVVEQG